jgi:phage FluMu protein Com
MPRQSRTKLVPPKTEPKNQPLEAIEESGLLEQRDESVLTKLDMEIECPRCNDIMKLQSNFDELVYTCESCNFLLKCV